MPQMGESIAEGTIVRWIKKVGDSVDRDEPLFEISTDKVDAEIPSPAAGTLLDISVKEGETVPVNSVVATIGAAGEAAPGATRAIGADDATDAAAVAATAPASGKGVPPVSQADGSPAPASSSAAPSEPASGGAGVPPAADRQRSSPLVRRIAKEHGIDIGRITGTGVAGRVTKQDILGYLDSGQVTSAASAPTRLDGQASYSETVAERPEGREGGPVAPVAPEPPCYH